MRNCFIKFSLAFFLLSTSLIAVPPAKLVNELAPTQSLNLVWKTRPGLTHYRSTISFQNGQLVMASGGTSFSSFIDDADGIYIMDPSSGKVTSRFLKKSESDKDVNGIAATTERIFAGSDDNTLYCLNWRGEEVWSTQAGGDIECAPALEDFNGDGTIDVCFATESGEILVLDGKDGTTLWSYVTDFMPVWTYPSSKAFMASPSLADLNKDGIRDIVIGSRNGTLFALNGKTGELLWTFRTQIPSGIFSSVFVTSDHLVFAESYNVLYVLTYQGEIEKTIFLGNTDFARTFSSPVETPKGTFVIGASGPNKAQQGVWFITPTETLFKPIGKVSATPIIADILGKGFLQCLVLTETNGLHVFNEEGALLAKYALPYSGEASPFVDDINNDGLLELILLTSDQYISCYQTTSSGQVYWGSFRGNVYNTGRVSDRLWADFPDLKTPKRLPSSGKGSYTISQDYLPLNDMRSLLISDDGIGPAKLEMPFGRLKAILGSKATYKETTLDVGMKATAIYFGDEIQFYILYPTFKTLSLTDPIAILGTNNPNYRTEKGIGPGSTIEEGASKYGTAILTYHSEHASEELIRFQNKPVSLWFARYGATKAGLYPNPKSFNSTSKYKAGSTIDFIGVKR